MKKTILFCIAFLITVYWATAQPNTLLKPDTPTVKLDSTQHQTIQEFLIQWNAWNSKCGEEGLALIAQGKGLGLSVVDEFRDLPAPVTQEAVKQWTDKIDLLFGGLGSIVTVVLTFFLSLFKKDPQGTIGKVQAVFNTIRTRYLLAISAVAVAGFGVFYFKDGAVEFGDILTGIGLALGVAIGGIGVKGLLEMFGLNLSAKKVSK